MNTIDAIKKAMKDKTLIVGQKSTIRNVKNKKVKLVVVAKNAPKNVKEEIENLCKIASIEYVNSDKDNLELGATCRKPFGVSILSIKK